MKKILLAAALLFCSLGATAGTTTLGPDECGIVKQCIDIPNDTADSISLYGAPGYPYFYVELNGVPYKTAQASGYSGDQVPAVDANGDVLYITYSFSTYVTCVRSGRGQHCSTHYNLTGGTVTR